MTLPKGWTTAPLGDITEPRVKQAPPGASPVQYIDIGSIDRDSKRVGATQKVDGTTAPTRARQWVRSGDVLVSMTRPNLNAVAIVTPDLDGAVASTGFDVLRSAGIEPKWIFYRVRSQAFVQDVCQDVQGVVYPAIRPDDVRRHSLPIPPTEEQRRIIEAIESYFSRLDAAVDSLKRGQAKLDAYRASILKAAVEGRLVPTEAQLARAEKRDYEPAEGLLKRVLAERRFRWEKAERAKHKAAAKSPKGEKWTAKYHENTRPDASELADLPAGWSWTTVETVASDEPRSIQSGPFGSSLLHSEFRTEGRLVIGIDNVQDGFFSIGAEHRISEKKYHELERYRARGGDVLVTVMATVGRTCVLPENVEPSIITKHVYRVTPDRQLIEPRFLHLALWGAPIVRAQMFGQVIGQTRPGLNGSIIRKLMIPLPPRVEQVRIVEEVERRLSFRDRALRESAHCRAKILRLRNATLKWAFEGKLVDQQQSEESARALLDPSGRGPAAASPRKRPSGRNGKVAS